MGPSPAAGLPGLIALAVAMGVGRFAFTPLLPMMQADAGLGLAAGGWLASANYAGYLVGALAALRMHAAPGLIVRGGLAAIVATTAAMAFTDALAAWIALRFVSGVASAWVLVFVSSWGFARTEWVFSGVGTGIAVTGVACLALMAAGAASTWAWLTLAALSLAACAAIWRVFSTNTPGAATAAPPSLHWTPEAVRLVACYGIFGFGYIVPATFLPAMAREVITDPLLYGLSWPAFGAAAAASTMLVGRMRHLARDRAIWAAAHVLMAIGVAASMPELHGLAGGAGGAIFLSALLVGGTFMVITMVGLQEARRTAGASARPLMAAMTSAFAAGQIAGPLVVSFLGGYAVALALAAVLLAATAVNLWRSR
jgi:MFS family permease